MHIRLTYLAVAAVVSLPFLVAVPFLAPLIFLGSCSLVYVATFLSREGQVAQPSELLLPRIENKPNHLKKSDVSLPDLIERAQEYGNFLAHLVELTEARIMMLTKSKRGAEDSGDMNPFLRDAVRVVEELKTHLETLRSVSRNPLSPQFLEVEQLINKKVEVPRFGWELWGEDTGWSRTVHDWAPILNLYLRRVESRQEQKQLMQEHSRLKGMFKRKSVANL